MPAYFIRAIKPTRRGFIDPAHFLAETKKELKDLGKDTEKELAKPTANWNSPPSFKTDIGGNTNQLVMTVGPVGAQAAKYTRIDFGTPARVIYPRKPGGVLKYQRGYMASTVPGTLRSRTARRSGKFVYKKYVHYPGIQARYFSKQVYKKMRPEFRRRMENLVKREARRGGMPI